MLLLTAPRKKKNKELCRIGTEQNAVRCTIKSDNRYVFFTESERKHVTNISFSSDLGSTFLRHTDSKKYICLFCVFNFQLPITIFGSRLYLNCCPSGRRFIASLPHARGACRILPSWIPPKTLQVDPSTVEIRQSHDSMMTFDDSSGDKTTLVKAYRGEN